MAKQYDIAILGATPAGYAAACMLAGAGRDTIVLDAPTKPTESPLSDWVPKDLFKLKGLPAGLRKAARPDPFARVRYHNAALQKDVAYKFRSTAGYLMSAGSLVKALRDAAVKAGARNRNYDRSPGLELGEDDVALTGKMTTRAKILLVAHNQPNAVIGDLALPVRTLPHSQLVAAGLDVSIPSSSARKELSGEMHIVERTERSEMGMFFVTGTTLHVRVVSASAAAGMRASELSSLVADLQRSELLPGNLPLGKATGAVWMPPAGVALDMESHVAKRCLLTGTAGGFAGTITGQTLAPTVRSALIAADVANQALDSNDPQDALMKYKTAWRKALADYLRPPSTSLQMLLPLLFVNQGILSRFTRAMLYGENI